MVKKITAIRFSHYKPDSDFHTYPLKAYVEVEYLDKGNYRWVIRKVYYNSKKKGYIRFGGKKVNVSKYLVM